MKSFIARRRPTPSMVVALTALMVALGGTGYAAIKLPKNSVGSRQIKKNAVTGAKVADGSLFANDFASGQIPKGPKGDVGAQGRDGTQGKDGSAGRSATDPLASGQTIHGAWAVRSEQSGGDTVAVTFPEPAPVGVDSQHVVGPTEVVTGAGCTGTADAPVAGPGFVCIYKSTATADEIDGGSARINLSGAVAEYASTSDGSPYGFDISIFSGSAVAANGTWAYTAP